MPRPKRKSEGLKDISTLQKSDNPGSRIETNKEDSQPGGAAASESAGCDVRVKKEEDDGDYEEGHLHRFTVKFSSTDKKYLCGYGENWMTVEEALKRDCRFSDDLGDFTLTDNENPNSTTFCTGKVHRLHNKAFEIPLALNKGENDENEQENPCATNKPQREFHTKVILDAAKQRGVSVKTAVEKKGSDKTDEVLERLRQQFPELKNLMQSRFPDDSYQKELKLRQENFGKIQQSFSEVHRVRKLLRLGRSVCKVIVKDVCEGTGFVLFENFILTNAHLFGGYVEGVKLQEDIDVLALFNYEEPEPNTNFYSFSAEKTFIDFDKDLDYAILKLNPHDQNCNVPPGLLKKFGPMPHNGEACIIGHPKGEVKKMDPICIIEKEKREQAVCDYLQQYRDTVFIIQSISQVIKDKGIEDIMVGRKKAEEVETYNTFMYHGSSGSPVFDAHCRVFGLHTAGYTYGFPNHEESVIEFAHPLLSIFEKFVSKLKETGNEELLKKVDEEAQENPHLKRCLNT